MLCLGDGEGRHHVDCDGVATLLGKQDECPPLCEHPVSQACFDWALVRDVEPPRADGQPRYTSRPIPA